MKKTITKKEEVAFCDFKDCTSESFGLSGGNLFDKDFCFKHLSIAKLAWEVAVQSLENKQHEERVILANEMLRVFTENYENKLKVLSK